MTRSTLHVSFQADGAQGSSPTPDRKHRLQVPDSKFVCEKEEFGLLEAKAVLCSSLGLCKSLSTSDIFMTEEKNFRSWVSDDEINCGKDKFENIFPQKLESISRSCSTWVAVGDMVSTSQLPSPQTKYAAIPTITEVDFIRSINKKVRQNYIRRRLLMSYRIFKRMPPSDSEKKITPSTNMSTSVNAATSSAHDSDQTLQTSRDNPSLPSVTVDAGENCSKLPLSSKDVHMDHGRPLSRYERNIIIFNWLQSLDDITLEMPASASDEN